VHRVILYDTELCIELNNSIKIMYTKIYKIYLGYTEKMLHKNVDFVLKVLKVLKPVLKLLQFLKIIFFIIKDLFSESNQAGCK
jgi:hypothetical protein